MTPDEVVRGFAEEVGGLGDGPVVAVGGRSAFDIGGPVDPEARAVRAPVGVVEHQPDELTVRVRVGTPVVELRAVLAEAGQRVALPIRSEPSTVGGVLAAGQSGWQRLGWGPIRDTVLEATVVLADGRVAKAGGPTVKNVTGYDLCRVLVGSIGTLALLAEVVLRTRPLPPCERWFTTTAGPGIERAVHRPAAALWDGTTSWLLLDGHPADVEAQAMAHGLQPTAGPPSFAGLLHRWSMAVADLPAVARDGHGPFLAELGVGVVHRTVPPPSQPTAPAIGAIHQRLKASFDPSGRLAPGRCVLPTDRR